MPRREFISNTAQHARLQRTRSLRLEAATSDCSILLIDLKSDRPASGLGVALRGEVMKIVVIVVADVALASPRSSIVEIAGAERARFNEIVARYLKAIGDPRKVVSDPEAPILGRAGRGALARAVGRGAPRPHRLRRMASPLTPSGLIP
ncbi:MAG TPA: hypothetical protein VGI20_02530 [Rhizomicrobium sp.]